MRSSAPLEARNADALASTTETSTATLGDSAGEAGRPQRVAGGACGRGEAASDGGEGLVEEGGDLGVRVRELIGASVGGGDRAVLSESRK